MTVHYQDELGWARIDDFLSPERAQSIARSCLETLAGPDDQLRPADKPHGGTLRLVDVSERIAEAGDIPDLLAPIVSQILPTAYRLRELTFRCPQPGFGDQRLHADGLPRLSEAENDCATAIVALGRFSEKNGATRLVPGSHRRPDLQRQAGQLDSHPEEIRLIGPAGTCFVFCGHVLHSGTKNLSSEPRPALQAVFRTGDQQNWANQ